MNHKLLQLASNKATMICEEKADNSAWVWENEFAKAIVALCIAEL